MNNIDLNCTIILLCRKECVERHEMKTKTKNVDHKITFKYLVDGLLHIRYMITECKK